MYLEHKDEKFVSDKPQTKEVFRCSMHIITNLYVCTDGNALYYGSFIALIKLHKPKSHKI